MSAVVELVRERVHSTPVGEFVHTRDLVAELGHEGAVNAAMHRTHRDEDLVLVRRGLYYKGKRTKFGTTRPDPYRVAREVAKVAGYDSGVGPSGYSAARALGLTTQVPTTTEVSVPGRAPKDFAGVHFTSRSGVARRGLSDLEVAVLEVLREWPRFAEDTWAGLVDRVRELVTDGEVDLDSVRTVARRERHTAARKLANRLAHDITIAAKPVRT